MLANLRNANLSGADLFKANLSGADLFKANLQDANLQDANLSGAGLTKSNLSGANLTKSILIGTNLSNANLAGAILLESNIQEASLSGANLSYADLSGADLRNTNLSAVDLFKANLQDANLQDANLIGASLTNSNLSGANLINADLTGAILSFVDLSGAILSGTNLSNANLAGADLSNKDLTGTILTFANLSGANLAGVDLSNKDLTGTILTFANLSGANLAGVDLSNKDLTETILSEIEEKTGDWIRPFFKDVARIKMIVKNPNNLNWPALDEIKTKNLSVTRYDLSGDVEYLATKEGFLFELKNNESKLILDLNTKADFYFPESPYADGGLLGLVSKDNLVYVAYSTFNPNKKIHSLVVDEYSIDFTQIRNIIKIDGFFDGSHFGGALALDSLGSLYLSVGEGGAVYSLQAQNRNDYRGKILRLDVSSSKLEPEIIAMGVRSPWGLTIDSKDRMFVMQCGNNIVEAIYLLDSLYSDTPANFGWPVFEGSVKSKNEKDRLNLIDKSNKSYVPISNRSASKFDYPQSLLMFKDIVKPIFESSIRPGCMTSGVYLDNLESFLFADWYGTIGLLKQQENGVWNLTHKYKQDSFIVGFGLDKKTKKIFIAPDNRELEILVDHVKHNQ